MAQSPVPPVLDGYPEARFFNNLIKQTVRELSESPANPLAAICRFVEMAPEESRAAIFHALVTSSGFGALGEDIQTEFVRQFVALRETSAESYDVGVDADFIAECLKPIPTLDNACILGDLITSCDSDNGNIGYHAVALLLLATMHDAASEPEEAPSSRTPTTAIRIPDDIKLGVVTKATRVKISTNVHSLLFDLYGMVSQPDSFAAALYDDSTRDMFGEWLADAENHHVSVEGATDKARLIIQREKPAVALPAVIPARRKSRQEDMILRQLASLHDSVVGNPDFHGHIRELAISLWAERLDLKHGISSDAPSVESQQARHIFLVAPPGAGKSTSAFRAIAAFEAMGLANPDKRQFFAAHDVTQKYIGWTGQFVADKFREAAGGSVVFDGFDAIAQINSFGPQAVNAVNDEITKPRRPSERPAVFFYTMYPQGMEAIFGINGGLRSRVTVLNIAPPDGKALRMILSQQLKERGLLIGASELESCGAIMDTLLRQRQASSGYGRMAEVIANHIQGAVRRRMFEDGTLSAFENTVAGNLPNRLLEARMRVMPTDLPLYNERTGRFVARPTEETPRPNGGAARMGAADRAATRWGVNPSLGQAPEGEG